MIIIIKISNNQIKYNYYKLIINAYVAHFFNLIVFLKQKFKQFKNISNEYL